MKAHLIDTHLLVPRSRSSAKFKVKYRGHVSQKMGAAGGISVSQTHLVVSCILTLPDMPILGSSNSAANKDMMSKIWTNGVQLSD